MSTGNKPKPKYHHIAVTEREYDTIIAALRLWQTTENVDEMPEAAIASEHGSPLTPTEIDALIERVQSW